VADREHVGGQVAAPGASGPGLANAEDVCRVTDEMARARSAAEEWSKAGRLGRDGPLAAEVYRFLKRLGRSKDMRHDPFVGFEDRVFDSAIDPRALFELRPESGGGVAEI
jgi:hypothetical protein